VRLNQCQLIGAILLHIAEQTDDALIDQSEFNAVVRAANSIVEAFRESDKA